MANEPKHSHPSSPDVAFILNEAELHLARSEPSVTTQRLELAVEMFWRTVDSWETRPPAAEQLNRLRDHVAETLKLSKSTLANEILRRSA
jgi:hypothetical protein